MVMNVFYVMVWVLVAGAVPSHGRTESESTVFNKTRPHESMNNVTVSSSKLETYHYLHLAMQWPMSFCNSRPPKSLCRQQVPRHFTVHGLWPQKFQNRVPLYVDCTSIRHRSFDSRQIEQFLVPSLNQYWPDLTYPEFHNQQFWAREYEKHGSCTFDKQAWYFRDTLSLVASLGDLALKLSLYSHGSIIPGGRYRAWYIRDAVHGVTNLMPVLSCGTNGKQLLEIRFCAGWTRSNVIQLTDCKSYFNPNCGNGWVLLPDLELPRP